ncbi:hypothetical protein I552_4376 [Mycobacterium xenopi 3993]|nr:hypothetical protein I552_4376 [Mycobacterium xenopi 3993]
MTQAMQRPSAVAAVACGFALAVLGCHRRAQYSRRPPTP